MRALPSLVVVLLLSLGTSAAFGVLCAPDPTPAATLLIPSFVVDVSAEACEQGNGVTTLFSVNNATSAPQLAHVTLWTDQGIPVLDFDIYLTGYDVQTLNLRDVFCRGILPQTGLAVSPRGGLSEMGSPLPSCNNTTTPGGAPNYQVPFNETLIGLLQEWFTGRPSTVLTTCAGSGQAGDSIAVGYATIDQVEDCTLAFPSDLTYQQEALGHANVLWGDYAIQDPANNFAQGFHAVHIEAAAEGFFEEGDRTFYGRYNGATAIDRREPLPTTYAARYARAGAFDDTVFHIWRETDASAEPFGCSALGPDWWPLRFTTPFITFWNEAEAICQLSTTFGANYSDPLPANILVPNAVNLCRINGDGPCEILGCGFDFGWVLFDLRSAASIYGDGVAQAYVTTVTRASGRFSAGYGGLALDSGCAPGTVPVTGPFEGL